MSQHQSFSFHPTGTFEQKQQQQREYLHGFIQSFGKVQLFVFNALDWKAKRTKQCSQQTHIWENSVFHQISWWMFTYHQEGLLQVSFDLLCDALLHVIRAVVLVPLEHWQRWENVELSPITDDKNNHLCTNMWSIRMQAPFWRWGTLLSDMMEIQVGTSVPLTPTPAWYRA